MSDDFFKNLAKKKAEEEAQRQESSGFTYEEQLWTGFKKAGTAGSSKIVRMVDPMIVQHEDDYLDKGADGKPIFNEYTAKIVNLVEIYDDNNNKAYMYVPDKRVDKNHIYWKLMDTVMAYDYVDQEGSDKKKKVYLNDKKNPKLFHRFEKNGYDHGVHKNKYDKGWAIKRVLIANVIDRARMEEHREQKHTMLLSKNVNEHEGKFYYDKGVPAHGFTSGLLDTVSHYGQLNNYDLLLVRNGTTEMPWKIRNASKYIEEVPENLQSLVVNTPLTEEELSWERYEISRLFGISSDEKWFNRFKKLVKEVDVSFNTNLHDELMERAEKAKEERIKRQKEAKAQEESTKTSVPVEKDIPSSDETQQREEPPKTRSKPEESTESNTPDVSWEYLKSLDSKDVWVGEEFFEECKPYIQRIVKEGDEPFIEWKEGLGLEKCFDCPEEAPSEAPGCLKCGAKY